MSNRDSWRLFGYYEWHKGFYNDDSFKESLFSIQYEDFLNCQMMMNFPMVQRIFYSADLATFSPLF